MHFKSTDYNHINEIVYNLFYLLFIWEFNVWHNRIQVYLSNIKADFFIEDLLNDIYNRHLNQNYIIYIIILLSFSLIIFIIAWIFRYIFTKRYMELLNNKKNEI